MPIDYDISSSDSIAPKPLVIFIHGFKAFKDWGFYPFLCESLADAGAIALRFSLSLAGVVDGRKLIYDVEKFAANTTSRELKDVKDIINAIKLGNLPIFSDNWNGDIYLAGHSKGGALSILAANEFSEIKKISAIASVSKLDRYSERQKELWKSKGAFEFTISHTKQKLRLDYSYLEDMLKNKEKYNLPKVVNTLNMPLQIIHGKQDVTVGIKEAYELAYEYRDKSNLDFVIIEKAGHGLGATHPFRRSNDILDEMVFKIIDFFELKK